MSNNFAIYVWFIGKVTKKRYNTRGETLSSISWIDDDAEQFHLMRHCLA
jgi:hypothetical protein